MRPLCSQIKFEFSFQVLFRYAIAIFKLLEDPLLRQCDYMGVFNTLRTEIETLTDVRKLTQVRRFPPETVAKF